MDFRLIKIEGFRDFMNCHNILRCTGFVLTYALEKPTYSKYILKLGIRVATLIKYIIHACS